MRVIVAHHPDELAQLPIHDAWFDPADLVHDEQARTLTLTFAQDPDQSEGAPQPELISKRRLSTEYRAPLVGWRLPVSGVRAVRHRPAWGDMGMLLDLSYIPAAKTLVLESNGKLELEVDALHVEASGGEEVVAWSRRRVSRFGGISDTRWR